MKIRVTRSFGVYKRGQVFDWADGLANLMIAKKLVEPVEAAVIEEDQVERAAEEYRPRRRRQRET